MRALNRGAGYLVWQLQHRMQRMLEQRMAQARVTLPQASALARLEEQPGVSSAELARHLLLTPQAVSLMITRLADVGYLTRGRPATGRSHPLTITDAGRAALDAAERAVREVNDIAFGELTDDERTQLHDLLDRSLRSVTATPEPRTDDP